MELHILAAESGWNEQVLIGVFLKGLNDNLQNELGNRDKSEPNIKKLTSQAIYVDKRLGDRHR